MHTEEFSEIGITELHQRVPFLLREVLLVTKAEEFMAKSF